jgi:predicted transcriptional regulator
MGRKLGRRPAKWMYELVTLTTAAEKLSMAEVAELMGVSKNAVNRFAVRANIPADYRNNGRGVIERVFDVSELREATKRYIAQQS